jgi:hypothetical protein
MENILEHDRCVACCEDVIHPYKTSASNLLEILDDIPNHSYLALFRDPK